MIRNFVLKGGKVIKNLHVSQLKKSLKDKKAIVWVDLEAPTAEEYELVLKGLFGFHPLSVEDCKKPFDLPKLDVYGNYIFFVFHSLSKESEKGYYKQGEIDFFLGKNFLVSVHIKESRSINHLADKLGMGKGLIQMTSDFMMYEIIDFMVDLYFPLLDTWDDSVESLETQIVTSKPNKKVIMRLVSIKKEVLSMRKSIIPQRDVVSKLLHADIPYIHADTKAYFKDVYDHIILVYTEIEIQRDILNSTLQAYMSVLSNEMNHISNKMNAVMKKLTVIATIFMPLTFLVGVYGMNFEFMPGLHSPNGFIIMVVLMVLMGAIMLFFFKKRKWM